MLNFAPARKAVKTLINKAGYSVTKPGKKELQFLENSNNIYEKYHAYTMIPKATFIENLRLCQKVINIRGSVVECGVWRGGMIASISEILGNNRRYYLFDSFEGLPPAKQIDGEGALAWQNDKDSIYYYDNCKAEELYADQAMKIANVSDYTLIKGWFSDTIPSFSIDESIALLRLDGDWYDSTMQCIEALYPKVAQGGIIIVDDYYAWDGCSRAIHDYLSTHQLPSKIRQVHNNCYIMKE